MSLNNFWGLAKREKKMRVRGKSITDFGEKKEKLGSDNVLMCQMRKTIKSS
jgi:hypothetical protein